MESFKGGRCLVANEVIDTVTALAASRVEGVMEVRGFNSKEGKLRRNYKQKILTKSEGGHIVAGLTLVIDRDYSIIKVCEEVQEAVKAEIESMFGLICDKVDIIVE